MTKRELIDEILTINHTAEPAFLARFEDAELGKYLSHLHVLDSPRLSGDASRYDRYFRNCPKIPATRPQWRTEPRLDETVPATLPAETDERTEQAAHEPAQPAETPQPPPADEWDQHDEPPEADEADEVVEADDADQADELAPVDRHDEHPAADAEKAPDEPAPPVAAAAGQRNASAPLFASMSNNETDSWLY